MVRKSEIATTPSLSRKPAYSMDEFVNGEFEAKTPLFTFYIQWELLANIIIAIWIPGK
jgi:hypothetical protein